MGRKKAAISTQEFDSLMEEGEELVSHLDLSTARRPGLQTPRGGMASPREAIRGVPGARADI